MIIKNAGSSDLPRLQVVRQLEAWRMAQRLDAQTAGRAEFLMVEENFQVVSFVFLKYSGKQTYPDFPDIEDLYTKEQERGKGYATALLQACEAKAKQKGFGQIGLAASIDPADPARRLYEKLGYQHDGKARYVDGVYDGVKDWVIDMVKNLGE